MRHTITVLQDDIDNGMSGSPRRCAIALAANRELFRDDIMVGGRYLSAAREFHAALPDTAVKFIPVFDHQREQAEPFKFEIDMVDGPVPAAFRCLNSAIVLDEAAAFAGYEPYHYEPYHSGQLSAYQYISKFATGGPVSFAGTASPHPGYSKNPDVKWTPEFGSAALTYAPLTWAPPSLTII